MQVYSYSEARQKFATVFKQAENTGKVIIRTKEGRMVGRLLWFQKKVYLHLWKYHQLKQILRRKR